MRKAIANSMHERDTAINMAIFQRANKCYIDVYFVIEYH